MPPQPPAGYIVEVTNAGEINIQVAGGFGNIIPEGPQVLMPCTISYIVKPKVKLCKNVAISSGASDITQFPPDSAAANDGYRDTSVNDAYAGVVAWAWCDNSMVADKTNEVMNAMVAVGKVDKNGKLKVNDPIQLTDLTPGFTAQFDQAVTINRADPRNIIVSYSLIDRSHSQCPNSTSTYNRAVSFDGGRTWPAEFNGPLQLDPPFHRPCGFDVFDYRGVGSDQYGNIWAAAAISTDDAGNTVGQPFYAVSFDKGKTFSVVYTVPDLVDPVNTFYEFPQFCFGTDENGQYGLWHTYFIFSNLTFDSIPYVGFIPINGFGLANIDTANAEVTAPTV